jgi:site-specific DNA-methyltransferase (adenine-specific)
MFVFSKGCVRLKNPLKEPSKNAGKVVKRTCRDNGSDVLKKSTSIVPNEKVRGNVWFYGSKQNKSNHPAIFPEQLANDHIISWSNENDVVFDPFMGSGTTGKMALLNNRKFIGIEKVEEYFDIAKDRIEKALN